MNSVASSAFKLGRFYKSKCRHPKKKMPFFLSTHTPALTAPPTPALLALLTRFTCLRISFDEIREFEQGRLRWPELLHIICEGGLPGVHAANATRAPSAAAPDAGSATVRLTDWRQRSETHNFGPARG